MTDQPAAVASQNDLLDVAGCWDGLPPEVQRQFGLAAMVLGIGLAGEDGGLGFDAAQQEAFRVLEHLTWERIIPDGCADAVPRPDLSAIGVRFCHACGCTDAFACLQGCSWAADTLCTSCVEGGQPA